MSRTSVVSMESSSWAHPPVGGRFGGGAESSRSRSHRSGVRCRTSSRCTRSATSWVEVGPRRAWSLRRTRGSGPCSTASSSRHRQRSARSRVGYAVISTGLGTVSIVGFRRGFRHGIIRSGGCSRWRRSELERLSVRLPWLGGPAPRRGDQVADDQGDDGYQVELAEQSLDHCRERPRGPDGDRPRPFGLRGATWNGGEHHAMRGRPLARRP
jgi:hypothetical protein